MHSYITPRKQYEGDKNTPQSNLRNELKKVLIERNLLTAKSKSKVIQMLDDISPVQSNDADRRRNLRLKAIDEIFSSEKTYQAQLDTLMTFFVTPLKEQNIIDSATHLSLFGQLEIISSLSKELVTELEDDLDNLAYGFIKLAPFFKLYSVYAFDYKNSLFTIEHLTAKNSVFRRFLERTESRPEVQTKLQSLLIVPIQRVPRYRLLLQQVLLYTSPSDSDFKSLQDSIKQIGNTVQHIDSIIEDHENAQRLVNLQNSLSNKTPHIIKPSRKVVKEGVLQKFSGNGTIKRYCVLFSDIFMYCKVLKERAAGASVENSLECCCIFPLKKCKVAELFPGKFKITCQGDGIILSSDDAAVAKGWVKILQESIDMHIDFRKTLRKESSKRKPTRKREVKHFENDVSALASKKYNHQKAMQSLKRKSSLSDSETIAPAKKTKTETTNKGWFWPFSRFCNPPNIPTIEDEDENDSGFDPTYGFARFQQPKLVEPDASSIDNNDQIKDSLHPLRESFGSNKESSITDKQSAMDSPPFKTSTPQIVGVLRADHTNDAQKPAKPIKKRVTFNSHNHKPYEYSPQYRPPARSGPYNFLPQHLSGGGDNKQPNLSLRDRITDFFAKLLN